PVQRCDRLERVTEAECALGTGRGVDAGDRADVLVDDPERSVRVRHLAGSVAGLVRGDDLSGLVELVDGAFGLIRSPGVAAADCDTGATGGLWDLGGCGDPVGLGVDS